MEVSKSSQSVESVKREMLARMYPGLFPGEAPPITHTTAAEQAAADDEVPGWAVWPSAQVVRSRSSSRGRRVVRKAVGG